MNTFLLLSITYKDTLNLYFRLELASYNLVNNKATTQKKGYIPNILLF